MITIEIKDKNGRVLKNGDTIKYVVLEGEYEYIEFRKIHFGTEIKYKTMKIDPQKEYDEKNFVSIYCGYKYYDRENLLEIFDLPKNTPDDEFKECVIDYICDELKINPKDEEEFYDLINSFEII